jgi:hypothetical protein
VAQAWRRYPALTVLLALAVALLLWAALAPIGARERIHLVDIPQGALARRLAGDTAQALPQRVRLTLGVHDVLLVKNRDTVPHYLDAITVKPGKQLHLPFEAVAERAFTSSAHFGGKLTVVVEPWPDPGTARVRWRLLELEHTLRYY